MDGDTHVTTMKFVGINTTSSADWLHIKGSTPSPAQGVRDQSNDASSKRDLDRNSIGQSFMAGASGYLVRLTVDANDNRSGVKLRVFRGDGIGGTLLYEDPNVTLRAGSNTFDINGVVPVTAGSMYTWQLVPTSTTEFYMSSGNKYTRGSALSPSGWDHSFETYVAADLPTLFIVKNNFRVGIGRDNPAYALDVSGVVRADQYVTTSDARLKKEIRPIGDALQRLSGIRGVTYHRVEDASSAPLRMGLLAQDVERVFPEAVATDQNGYKAVSYSTLVAPLIESVKTLQDENARLRERLEKLESVIGASDRSQARRP